MLQCTEDLEQTGKIQIHETKMSKSYAAVCSLPTDERQQESSLRKRGLAARAESEKPDLDRHQKRKRERQPRKNAGHRIETRRTLYDLNKTYIRCKNHFL
jgi:hypothetical protein